MFDPNLMKTLRHIPAHDARPLVLEALDYLSQREIADLLGVTQPTIARWASGESECKGPAAKLLRYLTPQQEVFK